MSETQTEDWRCARCDKPQPFVVDTPCTCGCWWLKTTITERRKHVGGPNWPTPASAPRYECPHCGAVSYNRNDVMNRYCGRCHEFEHPGTEGTTNG